MAIPKYCALCEYDIEIITQFGSGDTPEEALDEFVQGGEFESFCANNILAPGDDTEIYIYSVVPVEDSPWPEDERLPEWEWCLDTKVDTVTVEAI